MSANSLFLLPQTEIPFSLLIPEKECDLVFTDCITISHLHFPDLRYEMLFHNLDNHVWNLIMLLMNYNRLALEC